MTKQKKELTLSSLYNYYLEHPESSWIMKPGKVPHLYSFVKKNNIKKVLDLGTGIGATSAIIALALEEKGVKDYEVHTVEQFEKCYNIAQEIMPEELKKNVTFHKTDVVVWETEQIPYKHFSNFKELPEGDWDLIVVDGPGNFLDEKGRYVELPNGDVLKMLLEDKLKAGTYIAWDGRLEALRQIELYFSKNFYYVPKGDRRNFNIIERKDNELEFRDERFESAKKLGYFD